MRIVVEDLLRECLKWLLLKVFGAVLSITTAPHSHSHSNGIREFTRPG